MTRLYHQLCCTCSFRPPSDHLHFNMMRLLMALFGVSCNHISSETNGRHVGVHEPPVSCRFRCSVLTFQNSPLKLFLFLSFYSFLSSYLSQAIGIQLVRLQDQLTEKIVQYKRTEWSYAERSKVERSKVEQNGATYNRTEQSKTERSKAKPKGAKQNRMEQTRKERSKVEQNGEK